MHWGRAIYICVIEMGPPLFRQWAVASSAPSDYRTNDIFSIGSLRTNWIKLRSEFKYFRWRRHIKNVVSKMAATLRRPQCIKHFCQQSHSQCVSGSCLLILETAPFSCSSKWESPAQNCRRFTYEIVKKNIFRRTICTLTSLCYQGFICQLIGNVSSNGPEPPMSSRVSYHYTYNYMNVTGPHWWSVNIGSGNDLVPSGNKQLTGPMLTQIFVAIWRH